MDHLCYDHYNKCQLKGSLFSSLFSHIHTYEDIVALYAHIEILALYTYVEIVVLYAYVVSNIQKSTNLYKCGPSESADVAFLESVFGSESVHHLGQERIEVNQPSVVIGEWLPAYMDLISGKRKRLMKLRFTCHLQV